MAWKVGAFHKALHFIKSHCDLNAANQCIHREIANWYMKTVPTTLEQDNYEV